MSDNELIVEQLNMFGKVPTTEELLKHIKEDNKILEQYAILFRNQTTEIQQLKQQIETYENPNDLTLMFMYCDEKAKNKIKELQQQLEEEKNSKNKAIEYIKESNMYYEITHYIPTDEKQFRIDMDAMTEHFLQILQNKE